MKGLHEALQQVQEDENWLEQQPLLQLVKDLDHAETLELGDSSRRNLNLLLDLHHRLQTSRLMLEAGLFRRESRGGHFRIDAPVALPQWQCHSRQCVQHGSEPGQYGANSELAISLVTTEIGEGIERFHPRINLSIDFPTREPSKPLLRQRSAWLFWPSAAHSTTCNC